MTSLGNEDLAKAGDSIWNLLHVAEQAELPAVRKYPLCCHGEFTKTKKGDVVFSSDSPNFAKPYLALPTKSTFDYDLNQGLEHFVQYADDDEYVNCRFVSLLKWIQQTNFRLTRLGDGVHIVTRRNILNILSQSSAYNNPRSWNRRKWTLHAYYLNDHKHEGIYLDKQEAKEKAPKNENEVERQRQEKEICHSGHKFEQYFTAARPGGEPDTAAPVDLNVVYYRVFQRRFTSADFDLFVLFHAEIDAVDPRDDTITYELKTVFPKLFHSQKSRAFIQAQLVGAKAVVFGVKEELKHKPAGRASHLHVREFKVLEQGDLERECFPGAKGPESCFNTLAAVLVLIKETALKHPRQYCQFEFDGERVRVTVLPDHTAPPFILPVWYTTGAAAGNPATHRQ